MEVPRLPDKNFFIRTGPSPPAGFHVHCSFQAGDSLALVPLEVPTLPRKCLAVADAAPNGESLTTQSVFQTQVTKVSGFTVKAVNIDGFPQPFGGDKINFKLKKSDRILGDENTPVSKSAAAAAAAAVTKAKTDKAAAAAAAAAEDEDNLTVAVKIEDMGDGSYRCSFSPLDSGPHDLHVYVNGDPIQCSPFFVDVLPPPLKFERISEQGVLLNGWRTEIAQEGVSQYCYGICAPALSQSHPSMWRCKIHEWGSGAFFGVIGGDHVPGDKPHRDENAFLWMDNDKVIMAGQERRFMDGWEGFQVGDAPVFKYDPAKERLSMQLHREEETIKTFSLPIGAPTRGAFRVLVVIKCFSGKTRVELLEAAPADWNKLAEIAHKSKKAKRLQRVADAGVAVTSGVL